MYKRRILITVSALLGLALLLLPQLAADVNFLLLGQLDSLTLRPHAGWEAVCGDRRVRQIYLLLTALLGTALLAALFSGANSLNYRSKMRRITPDISTPCAAGQGQYGTARWLNGKDYAAVFCAVRLDGARIDALAAAGDKTYEEVESYARTHPDAIQSTQEGE